MSSLSKVKSFACCLGPFYRRVRLSVLCSLFRPCVGFGGRVVPAWAFTCALRWFPWRAAALYGLVPGAVCGRACWHALPLCGCIPSLKHSGVSLSPGLCGGPVASCVAWVLGCGASRLVLGSSPGLLGSCGMQSMPQARLALSASLTSPLVSGTWGALSCR